VGPAKGTGTSRDKSVEYGYRYVALFGKFTLVFVVTSKAFPIVARRAGAGAPHFCITKTVGCSTVLLHTVPYIAGAVVEQKRLRGASVAVIAPK
jgi:hypothetical protein